MKILPAETKPSFKPIAVTFVFETQDEIDAMAALFNYGPTVYVIDTVSKRDGMGACIREGLVKNGADAGRLFTGSQGIVSTSRHSH